MDYIKTLKLSSKGQISIPKEARKALGIKTGENLVMLASKNYILLEKSKNVLESLTSRLESLETMLASEAVLKKEWDNEYDERWNKY